MLDFSDTTSTQAYLKAAFLGFESSGKTQTASDLAIGLHRMLTTYGLPGGGSTPVYFLDTETGSSWVEKRFKAAGIKLKVRRTRAFVDLVPAIETAEAERAIILKDSVTHFWRELVDAYTEVRNLRVRGLGRDDWEYLRARWSQFTDKFLNSETHCIMCGRAGFTYDTHEEHGKREFEKTGVRMKAEGETGFEPNLLVLMERWEDVNTKPVVVKRTATVLKDRSDCIDGKQFESPRFSDFLPHIEALNLGGEHIRIDPSRSSKASIERPDFGPHYEREQKNVVLDEIDCLLLKHYPSQTKEDKAKRGDLLERHVGSRSWERVRTYALNDLQQGYKSLKSEFEGGPGRDDAPFTVPLSNSPAPAESGIPF